MKIIYRAFDGTLFDLPSACLKYEKENIIIDIDIEFAPSILCLYSDKMLEFVKEQINLSIRNDYDKGIEEPGTNSILYYKDITSIFVTYISITCFDGSDKLGIRHNYRIEMTAKFKHESPKYDISLPDIWDVLEISDDNKIEKM